MGSLDLAELADSWQTHLEAERKAPATVRLYLMGVRGFLRWCDQQGRPAALDRATVGAYVAGLLKAGAEPATARARHLAVRRFADWLVAEGELDDNPLAGLKPPKVDTKVVPVLDDSQLRALIRACEGKSLHDRRDEAIVRLLAETGLRAGECIALTMADVNVRGGLLVVRMGKGGKGRVVPFGPQTGRALDRYLRMRKQHRLADLKPLWLGESGQGFGYDALRRTLGRRAKAAGIPGFHPHRLRHTAASRWLAKGGSEGGLMAVAGWSRREMLDRYTQVTRSERAAAEARILDLGDF
jgi:integrase